MNNIISGPTDMIKGYGKAIILLEMWTKICIQNVLNAISRKWTWYVSKILENMDTILRLWIIIIWIIFMLLPWFVDGKLLRKKLCTLSHGLYYTNISTIETYTIVNVKVMDPKSFQLWHNRLSYPGSTMIRRIIKNFDRQVLFVNEG